MMDMIVSATYYTVSTVPDLLNVFEFLINAECSASTLKLFLARLHSWLNGPLNFGANLLFEGLHLFLQCSAAVGIAGAFVIAATGGCLCLAGRLLLLSSLTGGAFFIA